LPMVLSDLNNETEALAFWRSLLANKGAAKMVSRALSNAKLPPVTAKAGMRVAREGGRNEPELILALARSGNLEDEARQLTPAEIKQIATSVGKDGDAARGEKIYRRADLACLTCHAIGGAGGKVGPDLTSIGASAPVDYLIESVLYPNRKVKEGFHSVIVETKDGQEISGILVRETAEQLFVRDASNKEVAVAKNNLEKRSIGGSIMPSGLTDTLSEQDQIDLYRFMAELGKAGAYDASKGNVARFWKLFPATIDTAQFGDERVVSMSLDDPAWGSAYSLVDGRLLRDDLKARLDSVAYRDPPAIYAAARFQVSKTGPVKLQFDAAAATGIWIDGKPADRSIPSPELTAGSHTLIVKLDARRLPEFIRVQTNEATFLTN
jgi:putative heme-binding domain-containing protein